MAVYWMDKGVDTGPIEAQGWCPVLPGEDAAALWRRALAPMGVRLLVQVVSRLAGGAKPQAVPQDERVAIREAKDILSLLMKDNIIQSEREAAK